MSNARNEPGDPDRIEPPTPGPRTLPDLATALAVGAGVAAVCVLVAAVAGSPGDGTALGAGLMIPAVMFTYVVLRRRHRDILEVTDERAQLIDLRSRAQGFLALVGLLGGVIVYRWTTDGLASAGTYANVLAAGVLVQFATRLHLSRQS